MACIHKQLISIYTVLLQSFQHKVVPTAANSTQKNYGIYAQPNKVASWLDDFADVIIVSNYVLKENNTCNLDFKIL